MIKWWRRMRRARQPFSVRTRGIYSDTVSPPLSFLRFASLQEALHWIEQAEDRALEQGSPHFVYWEPVDLRALEPAGGRR